MRGTSKADPAAPMQRSASPRAAAAKDNGNSKSTSSGSFAAAATTILKQVSVSPMQG